MTEACLCVSFLNSQGVWNEQRLMQWTDPQILTGNDDEMRNLLQVTVVTIFNFTLSVGSMRDWRWNCSLPLSTVSCISSITNYIADWQENSDGTFTELLYQPVIIVICEKCSVKLAFPPSQWLSVWISIKVGMKKKIMLFQIETL